MADIASVPYDPNAIDVAHKMEGPSASHWFGTDDYGRDYLTRALYGGRTETGPRILGTIWVTAIRTLPLPRFFDAATKSRSFRDIAHWFGTDDYGRDYLTRALYGGRVSLTVGFCAMVVTVFIGTAVGILSGYIGGEHTETGPRILGTIWVTAIRTLPLRADTVYGAEL